MVKILYNDNEFAVCVKPVGIASQNNGLNDMVQLLSKQLETEIYPVHRLDTATGGVMVFAKNKKSAAKLSSIIANNGLAKKYLAVVQGCPDSKEGVYTDLLFKDSAKNKSYVVKRQRKGVKQASLEYRVIAEKENKSLVEIMLHTGRTHQIRVQFSSRKMPLLGDGKYGSREKCGLALWSRSIEFDYDGKHMCFTEEPDKSVYPWNDFINI